MGVMASLLPFNARSLLGRIARRYAWSVPIVVVLSIVGSALEGAGIGLLIPLLTALLSPEAAGGGLALINHWMGSLDPATRLILVAGMILILVVLKNIVFAVNQIFVAWIDGRAGHDIRCALAHRLLRVGYPFHLAEEPARLVNIIASEAWRASDAIRAVFSLVTAAASVTIFLALLVAVEWRLTLAVLVGLLLIRFTHARLIHRLGPMSIRVSQANAKLAERMLVSVLAMRLIRVFGQERREEGMFAQASEETRRAMFRMERASARIAPLQEVSLTALFMTILLGGTLSVTGMAIPVLVTFLVLLQRAQPHLRALEGSRIAIASAKGSLREVEWLLDPSGKPAPPSGGQPYPGLRHAINFREVEFRYGTRPGAGAVLEAATFELRAGRSTALIGPSGSGKSTIVNLLCRLLEPTSGVVQVDGHDLAAIEPAAWRARISLAGQDIELVDGTIAENISYGAPGLPQADIEAAACAADAAAFIAALPDGYGSEVGNRGLNLSGGQRQRIGLARAIARRPDLLILDEATSAVDGVSEETIMRLLRESCEGMTVVVISHRASTLACCDDGVVIAGGRVVESGPLGRLAAYRRMVAASVN